jgi:hypothetical protein
MRSALTAPAVCVLCGLIACHETPEETRAKLLGKLHACLKEVSVTRPSPCRKLDLAPLNGIARQDLLAAFGPPTFCTLPPYVPKGTDCPAHYNQWSFYRLPRGTLGGGPELTCDVDQAGHHCAVVRWVNSE